MSVHCAVLTATSSSREMVGTSSMPSEATIDDECRVDQCDRLYGSVSRRTVTIVQYCPNRGRTRAPGGLSHPAGLILGDAVDTAAAGEDGAGVDGDHVAAPDTPDPGFPAASASGGSSKERAMTAPLAT